jgi:hypothetical protein
MSLRTSIAIALLGGALPVAPLSSQVVSNPSGLALGAGVAGIAVDADFGIGSATSLGVLGGLGLDYFVNPRPAVDAAMTIAPGTFDDWTARGQSIAIEGVDAVSYGFPIGVRVWPSSRED